MEQFAGMFQFSLGLDVIYKLRIEVCFWNSFFTLFMLFCFLYMLLWHQSKNNNFDFDFESLQFNKKPTKVFKTVYFSTNCVWKNYEYIFVRQLVLLFCHY